MLAITAQSLPSDIICEVLKYFSTVLLVRINGRATEFPWYLGHICSSWRIAFLSMAEEFWNKFKLYPALKQTPETERRCAAIAEIFLEHNRALRFSFDIHKYSRSRLVLDRFMKESMRWQDASFAVEESEIKTLLTIRNRLPHLRSLNLVVESPGMHLEYCRSESTAIPEHCRDIFKNAPHLTHVKLVDLSAWQFTWPSLVSLEFIERAPNPELLRVLPQMVNLEKLVIEEFEVDIGIAPIVLPRLKVLIIFQLSLLKILTTPALEQLSFEVRPDDLQIPSILPAFIRRSSCRLQIFGISEISATGLAYVLQCTPELKFLAFLSHSPLERIFEFLTYSPNKPLLVPELQTLRILFPRLWGEYRCPAVTALTTFLDSRQINQPSSSICRMQEIILARSYMCDDIDDALEEVQEECSVRNIRFRSERPKRPDWETYRLCGFDDDLVQYFRSTPGFLVANEWD